MRYLIGMIFILFSFRSSGQPEELKLTYEKALNIALKNNLDLQQAKNVQQFNRVRKQQSIAAFLPTVSAFGSADQIEGRQFDQVSAQIVTQKTKRVNTNLNVNLPLFSGHSRHYTIRSTNATIAAQQSQIKQTRQQTLFIVSQQYLQCLLDQEILKLQKKNTAYWETLTKQTRRRVQEGLLPISEQYAQEAQLSRAELALLSASNALEQDKIRLSQTLLLDQDVTITLADSPFESTRINTYSLDGLQQTAIESHPEIRKVDYQILSARQGVKIAKAAYAPQLSSFLNYGSNYSSFRDRSLTDQLINDNRTWSVGLNLSYTLFDKFNRKTNIAASRLEMENLKIQKEKVAQAVFLNLKVAWQNYLYELKNYEATYATLEASEKFFEIQQKRYILGDGIISDLLLANQTYVEAQAGFTQAKLNVSFQEIQLKYYSGVLNL